MDPQLRLDWENYHSQYLAGANTLQLNISPSRGQSLDLDTVDATYAAQLSRHYNPILERLYTNPQMADQAQAHLNQYLPDTDDDEIKWLRASSYPEIHLQLPADQWNEHNAENHSITLAPEDIRWNTCLLYTSPSPRDFSTSRMPSSA